ncbi:Uncharacterized protein APZ42_023317, partial [Daphnia magna]
YFFVVCCLLVVVINVWKCKHTLCDSEKTLEFCVCVCVCMDSHPVKSLGGETDCSSDLLEIPNRIQVTLFKKLQTAPKEIVVVVIKRGCFKFYLVPPFKKK